MRRGWGYAIGLGLWRGLGLLALVYAMLQLGRIATPLLVWDGGLP